MFHFRSLDWFIRSTLDSAGGRRFMSGIIGAVVGKGLTDSLGAFLAIAFGQIAEG